MFTFRRKPKKSEDNGGPPFIRTSPSLPELSAQGIPWPSNLVDLSQLPQDTPASPPRGAAKTSFTADAAHPVPFHKPWSSPGKATDSPTGRPIASLYLSSPPSAFETRKSSHGSARPRPSQRRNRNPTTFNVMVAGAQGVGKTSLLRLLLDTADISPTATADQKAAVERFLRGPPKGTESIQSACVEICESKYDRLLLSVIDTPGLDFREGHELRLERQVSTIVKYLDSQFADTLNEESKVVRQSKGDQHIHLCIYMIDPSSVLTEGARRAQSSYPTKVRSEVTVSYKPPDLSSMSDDTDSEDEEDENGLTMSPADIRVMRRIAARANVLPVIARADSLTDAKLAAVKKVVWRDLRAADLDFGVFGPVGADDAAKSPADERANGNWNGHGHTNSTSHDSQHSADDAAQAHGDGSRLASGSPEPSQENEKPQKEEANGTDQQQQQQPENDAGERPSRPVIKLRPTRLARRPSRSRSRLEMSETTLAEDPHALELINDTESVASVRFSAHIVAKTDLSAQLPFALITPEHVRRHRALKGAVASPSEAGVNGHGHGYGNGADAHSSQGHAHGRRESMVAPSEEGHAQSVAQGTITSPISPSTTASLRHYPYLQGPPADLKGVFVRRFRWGTVDVLNPEHCDFAALRTAVMSTHIKLLKIRTKEVLYEKYRTEKLLARRATRNIGEDETRRLLEDLGL
ncbi:Septin-domain-containing protein [Dichomitus squalens]|uniref:Septin-domain-containing protein n=1 Tax=Dichomitus squalens TaxID=114155 RepID=A0A4Q9Q4K8_9APHY|nr:Septin-domain-containing protein [Dichomitus squalens]